MSSPTPQLRVITLKPKSAHKATVIFSHGLGDSPDMGWAQQISMLVQSDEATLGGIQWVLPFAPVKPVSANGGMEMPAWFDLRTEPGHPMKFAFDKYEDDTGMLETARSLNALIDSLVTTQVPAEKTVIAGFSQGGAMSLLSAIERKKRLGGIAVMSGWLTLQERFKKIEGLRDFSSPVFWGHGQADAVVPFRLGQASAELFASSVGLKYVDCPEGKTADGEVNGQLEFHGYRGMQHSSNEAELAAFKLWLKRTVLS